MEELLEMLTRKKDDIERVISPEQNADAETPEAPDSYENPPKVAELLAEAERRRQEFEIVR